MALLLRFNQLRNSIWSSCPARLLMPHAGLSSGKLLDPKSYERRLFSTRVQETTSEHEQSVPLLIFDIKTTGFFQKRNRITEFAVHDLWAGKNNTFETLLNPEMDVPKYVAAVTNINNDLVCRPDVPRFSDVLPLLLAFVRSCQTPGKPIIWVAHNVKRFDGPFLAQKFDRCSAQMPEDWLFVDTLCLATKVLLVSADKRHLHDLESLCKRYGISVEGPPHRAMQEVMKLCQVFQKMSFDLKLTYEGLIDEAIKANYFSKFLN
nr:exonuclease DPD1, chloroplastic/mitochondrial-like [Aegilops tauschii subsp. strangulata]